jgi:hypothetical protein
MSVFYQPFGLPVFIPTASCGVFNGIFHKLWALILESILWTQ